MTQASKPAEQQSNDVTSEKDYDLIKEALMNNPRGRWFLQEYLNRNRPEDTKQLLEAIGRIEKNLSEKSNTQEDEIDPIRLTVIEMSQAINRTRQEIASIKPAEDSDNQLVNATEELSAIVESTEQATNTILEAAEEIQEAAWILREAGSPEDACDKIDNKTTDIYTACSFQDITGQRTNKIVQALYYIENRVNAMIDIWGLENFGQDFEPTKDDQDQRPDSHLLNGPALFGEGMDQSDVDDFLTNQINGMEQENPIAENEAADETREVAAQDDTAISIDDMEFDNIISDDTINAVIADNPTDDIMTDETADLPTEAVSEAQIDEPELTAQDEAQLAVEEQPQLVTELATEVTETPDNTAINPLEHDIDSLVVNETEEMAVSQETAPPAQETEISDQPMAAAEENIISEEEAQNQPDLTVDDLTEAQQAAILE